MLSQTHVDVCRCSVNCALAFNTPNILTFIYFFFIFFFIGHKCRARQPVQQQAEETAEAAEICRMSGQEGIKSSIYIIFVTVLVLICLLKHVITW